MTEPTFQSFVQSWLGITAIRADLAILKNRILLNEARMITNLQSVRDALSALTSGVGDNTTAIGSMDAVLTNISDLVTQLKQAAENHAEAIPQDILDGLTNLQTALASNKDHILGQVAKGTDITNPPPPVPPTL
jgi:hypothetical protein